MFAVSGQLIFKVVLLILRLLTLASLISSIKLALKPSLWMIVRSRSSRIFQDKSHLNILGLLILLLVDFHGLLIVLEDVLEVYLLEITVTTKIPLTTTPDGFFIIIVAE